MSNDQNKKVCQTCNGTDPKPLKRKEAISAIMRIAAAARERSAAQEQIAPPPPPKPQTESHWPGVDVAPLVARLQAFNDWRRGGYGGMPSPKQIGRDIDDAIYHLNRYARAIEATLENNAKLTGLAPGKDEQ